ncbi:ATP-dependent Clp protease adaptor protein ClpS [Cyclonatronum proteinivorum]|uniref:ATP-dependent Clp protease adapter protein ClpS n=1 Tax=Cyclonatronum proteinivorum TaxID=1457365 RepID=A0A345UNC5_9BACT|nr:ATP-dependent Clp protease adaptor ClpS [Cyclonatronum proteinivorum]AXJ01977.1 ATP-dependent Clp protease adaptor protein ClpS [Cyclonatronum proteinivorum]
MKTIQSPGDPVSKSLFQRFSGPQEYDPENEDSFGPAEEVKDKVEEPPRYVVYLLNDDYSTFDFVVHVLVSIFRKSVEDAIRITNEVHHKGKGVCGMYTRQIAETKIMLVEEASSSAGFPLRAVMEEA